MRNINLEGIPSVHDNSNIESWQCKEEEFLIFDISCGM